MKLRTPACERTDARLEPFCQPLCPLFETCFTLGMGDRSPTGLFLVERLPFKEAYTLRRPVAD